MLQIYLVSDFKQQHNPSNIQFHQVASMHWANTLFVHVNDALEMGNQ